MAELFTVLHTDIDSLAAEVVGVPDNYPVALAPVGNEIQVRIQGTAEEGTYAVTLSSTASITSANNAVFSRFSLDGGSTWEEGSRSAANSGDNLFFTYQFPKAHAGGAYDFILQMKKEAAQDTLTVKFCNIYIQRLDQ